MKFDIEREEKATGIMVVTDNQLACVLTLFLSFKQALFSITLFMFTPMGGGGFIINLLGVGFVINLLGVGFVINLLGVGSLLICLGLGLLLIYLGVGIVINLLRGWVRY